MLILLLLLVSPAISFPHQCNHKLRNPIITYLPSSGFIQLKTRETPMPLRIYVHYGYFFNKLPNREMIKKFVIGPAVKFWEETLMVKYPLRQPILLDRKCKGNYYDRVTVGSREIKVCVESCLNDEENEHLQTKCYYYGEDRSIVETGTVGEGVKDADLVLLVDSGIDCTNTTLASAMEDRIESKYNRPIIGSLNICPDSLDIMQNIDESIQTIRHEIMHILGLSVSLYAFFRDENGNPLTPRDRFGQPNLGTFTGNDITAYRPSNNTMLVFKQKEMSPVGERIREKAMLVTPNLVREARNYYNCSTLKGMLLENFGDKGNAWSHFEMGIAYNELMASVSNEEVFLSRLSLALLEDSGWYVVDYSRADNFKYAKGLGCDFVNKNCFEYIHLQLAKNLSTTPWCSDIQRPICSDDRTIEQNCQYMYGISPLGGEYKYFKDKQIYSIDPYVDYCPMYMVYQRNATSNYQCSVPDNLNNVEKPFSLIQSFGRNSKCFDAPIDSQVFVNSSGNFTNEIKSKPGCYNYRCSKIHGLIVTINAEDYLCRNERETISFSISVDTINVKGSLQCPKCTEICNKKDCASAESKHRRSFDKTFIVDDYKKEYNCVCSAPSNQSILIVTLLLAMIFVDFR